jgi:hypothetical protein
MAVLLGRQSAGTSADFNAASNPSGWKFTASASAPLAFIFAQTKVANAGITSVELRCYDDSAGGARPGALIGSGSTSVGVTGTGIFSASISQLPSITSGTVYWLAWRGLGEQFDFQGSTAGSYVENVNGVWADPWQSTGNNSGTIDAILWGEDAGTPAPVPDMYMLQSNLRGT